MTNCTYREIKPVKMHKETSQRDDVWVKQIDQHGCKPAYAIIKDLQNVLGNDFILAGGFSDFIDR